MAAFSWSRLLVGMKTKPEKAMPEEADLALAAGFLEFAHNLSEAELLAQCPDDEPRQKEHRFSS